MPYFRQNTREYTQYSLRFFLDRTKIYFSQNLRPKSEKISSDFCSIGTKKGCMPFEKRESEKRQNPPLLGGFGFIGSPYQPILSTQTPP